MYSEIKKPEERLSKDVVKVWMITNTLENLIGFIILAVLFYLNVRFAWKEWIGWILIAVTVFAVIGAIWSYIRSLLLYKNWRYDVSEEFLQLKTGALNEEHHLVPMTKIQSVATRQGPLLRKYGLRSVSIDTMGSSHLIPALPNDVAIALRNQIAEYAKIKEVES